MNGQKGVAIIVIAMVLTGSIGLFANMNEEWTTKVTYTKISDLEGIISENAGTVNSYESYDALTNVTGWKGNTTIPLMGVDSDGNTIVSPYVISPRNNDYTYNSYKYSVNNYTLTTNITGTGVHVEVMNVHANTNKSNVVYTMTPFQENHDEWLTYSDGSELHGGITQYSAYTTDVVYIPDFVTKFQKNSLIYFIGDERQNDNSTVAFASLRDICNRLGITLTNEYLLNIQGTLIRNPSITVDKFVSEESGYSVNIHLNGIKSTTNSVKYFQGGFQGINSVGNVVWESTDVYVATNESQFSLIVGIPSQTNPTYANPYEFVTLHESDVDLNRHSENKTVTWEDVAQTTGDIYYPEINTFNYWTEFPEFKYVTDVEQLYTPNTQIKWYYMDAILSDNTRMGMYENWLYALQYGIRGFYNAGTFYYTANGEAHTDMPVYVIVSLPGQQTMDTTSRNKVATVFTDELFNHFYPSPHIGDVIALSGVSGIPDVYVSANLGTGFSNNVKVTPYISGPTLSSSSDAYFTGISSPDYFNNTGFLPNNSRHVSVNDVWFEYTADGWVMKDSDNTYPRITTDSIYGRKGYIVYCNFPDGNIEDLGFTMTYREANVSWATTQEDVSLYIDPTQQNQYSLSDGSPFYGGEIGTANSQGNTYNLRYSLTDTSSSVTTTANSSLRWISLDKMWNKLNPYTTVELQFTFNGVEGIYARNTILTNVDTSTANLYLYNVTYVGSKTTIDRILLEDGVYNGYNGSTLVWTGNLSDLDLVIVDENSYPVTVISEGYRWADNPLEDTNVGFWSNSIGLDTTLINKTVSLFIKPSFNANADSILMINAGPIFEIDAKSVGSNLYNFSYKSDVGVVSPIGQYVGLLVKLSLVDNTISFTGVSSYESPVSYSLSGPTTSFNASGMTDLNQLFFLAIGTDWDGYIADTEVDTDPMHLMWGGFGVNLANYFPSYLPGFRMTIGGVVHYGDSLTINSQEFDVIDGKITHNNKSYSVNGLAIDFSDTGHTYLRAMSNREITIDLGTTVDYTVSGTGTWYFASGGFAIDEVDAKVYKWNPGWDLSFAEMTVLFMIILIGMAVVFMRVEWIGGLDRYDIIVLGIATIISFLLIGGTR